MCVLTHSYCSPIKSRWMGTIKGAKSVRQLGLQMPAHCTITLAAKYKSPEKCGLGKQKGKSKQTPNRTPQASFVAMLNSKGLLQIREEFLKEERSQEPFTRKNAVTRLGTSSWYKRNTETVSCTNPVCLYNSHSITAFPLTSVFKNK